MEKEFGPYPLALRLKAIGFDEPCFGWYSNREGNVLIQGYCETYLGIENCVKAPLYQQAFRWFREKYTLYSIISTIMYTYPNLEFYFKIQGLNDGAMIDKFNTYEEAELACLDKLIEIVENEKPL